MKFCLHRAMNAWLTAAHIAVISAGDRGKEWLFVKIVVAKKNLEARGMMSDI